MSRFQPAELDHEYDGIREYDNPTPGWWHAIFIATIIFSLGYVAFWHGSPAAWTVEQAWADDEKAEFARIFGAVGELEPDEATILSMKNDPKFMAVAAASFKGVCAACHASDGGGLSASGVNLTDDHYKNVKTVADLYKVITDGAAGGAMPAQKNRFSQNERILLAAYVAGLRGTKPASAKAPEGEVIPPWPEAPKPSPK
jgi:cytochrome c oxidase cbb3-type subunit 3